MGGAACKLASKEIGSVLEQIVLKWSYVGSAEPPAAPPAVIAVSDAGACVVVEGNRVDQAEHEVVANHAEEQPVLLLAPP